MKTDLQLSIGARRWLIKGATSACGFKNSRR